MSELKTGFEWCEELELRILDINDWETHSHFLSKEDSLWEEKIDKEDFLARLSKCKVKPRSKPRKPSKYLQYRMYGLVPYNISPIQQAIQYGHAVVEYGNKMNDYKKPPYDTIEEYQKLIEQYEKWARKDKTFIILNGGTTNNNTVNAGSLNLHLTRLLTQNVEFAPFYEPDLGDQLTAVVFLVDERVYDKELYPDFTNSPFPWPSHKKPTQRQYEAWETDNEKNKAAWIEKIGGDKNYWLREFIKPFRLA